MKTTLIKKITTALTTCLFKDANIVDIECKSLVYHTTSSRAIFISNRTAKNHTEDKRYYIFAGSAPTNNENENLIYNDIDYIFAKYESQQNNGFKLDFDMITAIERKTIPDFDPQNMTFTFSYPTFRKCVENILEAYNPDVGEKSLDDYYKFDETKEGPENPKGRPCSQFYAVFIKIPKSKVPENAGNIPIETILLQNGRYFFISGGYCYDITNLKNYIKIFDSRTYERVVYKTPVFRTDAEKKLPNAAPSWHHNMLIHGAPGTGKSRMVNEKSNEAFSHDNVRRVTFYEDYSYEKFVGAYMPVQKIRSTRLSFDGKDGSAESEGISYEFKPGVFALMLADAYKALFIKYLSDFCSSKDTAAGDAISIDVLYKIQNAERYLLIIEEINRAPAASVFGDMFQLLDRDNDGLSTYSLNVSEEFKEWFADRICSLCENEMTNYDDTDINRIRTGALLIASNLKIPSNLYIWATMNSADQGVFPLDSAFKRRWCYLYKSVDENRTSPVPLKLPGMEKEVNWDIFRNSLNMAIKAAGCMEEDKLIGTGYFNDNDFADIKLLSAENTPFEEKLNMINPLCDKLFAYLRNDVFRNNPDAFFKKGSLPENDYTSMTNIRYALINNTPIDEIVKYFDKQLLEGASSENNVEKSPAEGANG